MCVVEWAPGGSSSRGACAADGVTSGEVVELLGVVGALLRLAASAELDARELLSSVKLPRICAW